MQLLIFHALVCLLTKLSFLYPVITLKSSHPQAQQLQWYARPDSLAKFPRPWHNIEIIPEPNSFNSLSNQAQFALVCPSLVFYAWNYIGVIPKSTSSCTCQPGMGTWAGSRQDGIWSRPRHALAPGLLMLFQCKGGSVLAIEISGLFSICTLLQLHIQHVGTLQTIKP